MRRSLNFLQGKENMSSVFITTGLDEQEIVTVVINFFSLLNAIKFSQSGGGEGEASPPWRIKIAMTCLRYILRDECQTVGTRPLALLKPNVKHTQPTAI